MDKIAEGAEAAVFVDDGRVVKLRHPKDYRIKEIDERLRKMRTRREAKVIETLAKAGVAVPELISSDDRKMEIIMGRVGGVKLKDVLSGTNCGNLCSLAGEKLAIIHNAGIIHGDFTTSNILVDSGKIVVIDFGLSYFSDKAEDRAVDIHVFSQSLEIRSFAFHEKCVESLLKAYLAHAKNGNEVIARLRKVQSRGRNK